MKSHSLFFSLLITIFACSYLDAQELSKNRENLPSKPNFYKLKADFDNLFLDKKPEETKGWKWYKRLLWEEQSSIYPDGSYMHPFENAGTIRQIEEMEEIKAGDSKLSEGDWAPVGPDAIAKSYETRSGHGIGRVNCVAFHPNDINTFWIGTPSGGVWKTDNAGQSWTPIGDAIPAPGVSDIAVDPNDPDIIYVSTGDIDKISWVQNGSAIGVFKTTNGGKDWSATGLSYASEELEFPYSYIRKVLIHPENTNKLLAAGTMGVWSSEDAGDTWTYVVDSLLIRDIEQDPTNPDVLYVESENFYGYFGQSGVFKSTDFGQTWNILNTGITNDGSISRMNIEVSPADPNYVYILAANAYPTKFGALILSTDAGETWEVRADFVNGPNILGWYDGDQNDQNGQGTYDLVLIPDPNDKNKIYTGGINLWVSDDAGETFEIVSFWMNTFGKSIHADQHFGAYNANDSYFYICNDGGIYRTKEMKPGSKAWISEWIDRNEEDIKPDCPGFNMPTEWENLTTGLMISEFYCLGLSKNNNGYVSGGCQDNSCFYSNTSEWVNYVVNYDGMETMIHPDNPLIVYGSSQYGRLCKSTDGCETQDCSLTDTITQFENERGSWVTPFVMSPDNPDIIYGGFRNLWRTTNGGDSWEKFFNLDEVSNLLDNVNCIAIPDNNPDMICIAKSRTRNMQEPPPHELWLTKDGGQSWEVVSNGLPLDSLSVSDITISSENNDHIWISFSSPYPELKVFKSEDGGQSWINISKTIPNITIYSIAHQEDNANNFVYIGTSHGVWYTADSLENWRRLGSGLPLVRVNEIEINKSTNMLYAATYGRGIWMTELLTVPVGVEEENAISSTNIMVYPNPAKTEFTISLRSLNNGSFSGAAKLEIVDIAGRTVYSEMLQNGLPEYDKRINIDLLSGLYFVKLSDGRHLKVQRFVVEK